MTFDQAVQVAKRAMMKQVAVTVDFVNVDEGYKVDLLDGDGDWSGFYAYSAALDCVDVIMASR